VFTLFFPHFVSRAHVSPISPQIDHPAMDVNRMLNGCLTLLMGVVKKVLIANPRAATGPIP
jgi:D-alanyl-lipoteichoic acid acyltransferase DltB (MBOAT superfamily)